MELIMWKGKLEKPREKSIQTPFLATRNPHEVTETRTRDSSGGRRASNRLHHGAVGVENINLIIYPIHARFLEREISVLQRYRSVNCCFSVARTLDRSPVR